MGMVIIGVYWRAYTAASTADHPRQEALMYRASKRLEPRLEPARISKV